MAKRVLYRVKTVNILRTSCFVGYVYPVLFNEANDFLQTKCYVAIFIAAEMKTVLELVGGFVNAVTNLRVR